MSVPSPTGGVDPRVALATSIHASPGVYAVLVGSGISTAAGIPTGWQVVQNLAGGVARAEGVDLEELGRTATQWFAAQYGHEPRYDELLAALAPTDPARRDLLRRFFDPPPSAGGPIEPTDAHRVLAELCAQGRIRVLLTTNFDHLLERALDEAGASPQVLITPADRRGMEPLQHAATTVIKLHGDYRGAMLNTTEELCSYPADVQGLLAEIIDRYGLIVVGWSAEYDTALVESVKMSASRRYPAYWLSHHGVLTEPAKRLVDHRRATVIDIDDADEFFNDLSSRLERLDTIAARRRQPAALWDHHHAPNQAGPPGGWAVLPLLQLRIASVLAPVRRDDCSPIGPGDREAIVAALNAAAVSDVIWALSNSLLLDSAVAPDPPNILHRHQAPLGWIPAPGGHQSLASASYRMGGDASIGISSLLEIWLPRPQAGSVLITLDIGVSIRGTLSVDDAVRLWQAGLMLVSGRIPDALRGILPSEADVTEVEIHMAAPGNSGSGNMGAGVERKEGLSERVGLRIFGSLPDSIPRLVGQAMRAEGALDELAAGELAVDALERMALNCGFLDPRDAIHRLREDVRRRMPG